MAGKHSSRRDFIRLAATSTLAAGAAPSLLRAQHVETLSRSASKPVAPVDTIRIATIGMGIIGFIDTETALRVPGIEFVAAADCFDSRLVRTREIFGSHVETTRDYRELVARSDIDAILICTPDHWHKQIAIEAMEASKAVYCEKPMVQRIDEGPAVIEAQKRTGKVFQVGSQYASDLLFLKAKALYESGAIGELNSIEAVYNRNSALGAWQYSIPPDASTETIDWDMFLGRAPKRPFDTKRFFRWRCYQDYGTGMAGDLFVHLFTGIHRTTGALGPNKIVAQGGLRFWDDGRDVPDVMLALVDYPETEQHPSFTLSLQCNFADGGGGRSEFRFIGNEGAMTVGGSSLTLTRSPMRSPSEQAVVRGYNSVRTFSTETQEAFVKAFREERAEAEAARLDETTEFRVPNGYDSREDHFTYFFDSMRSDKPVYEDAVFGYRAAAPSLMANMSYWNNKIYEWDPVEMKIKA